MARARPARGEHVRGPAGRTVRGPAGAGRRRLGRSPTLIGLSAVVMATPLAVLGDATGPYDDPKAWALPILVALTALAWAVGARTGGDLGPSATERRGRILGVLVVAWMAWLVLTTLTSIAPALSVFGNFGRGMGLLNTALTALLFFIVQSECRTSESVRALVDAALLGSAPVCLLALGQAAGWDPLPGSWDPAIRDLPVRSTFGQHIFLSSYLVLLIPVAGARLAVAWQQWRSATAPAGTARLSRAAWGGAAWIAGALVIVALASTWGLFGWILVPWGVAGSVAMAVSSRPGDAPPGGPVAVALLAALLAAQIAVVVLARARGPLLGLLVGVAVALFVLLARWRAWRAIGACALAAALALAFLVLLNIQGSPLAPVARTHLFERLSRISDVEPGSPGWFRLRVWEGVISGWRDQLRGDPVIPGTSPLVRSVLGYGLETELIALNPMVRPRLGDLPVNRGRWNASYAVDRAHNSVLDHLVTTGLVGAGLWLTLLVGLGAVGLSRIRASTSEDEATLRAGAAGALLAHLAEGQVGIVTPVPLALFWIAAAWLTQPAWSAGAPAAARPRPGGVRWRGAVAATALATGLIAWGTTQWLLASVAYADGVLLGMAGRPAEAYAAFARARDLMPWLPLPAEAMAQTALRLAAAETEPARRTQLLRDGEAALVEVGRHATPGAVGWTLTAQLAFGQARAGDRAKLDESLQAFALAARLSPANAQLLAQWGWARLDAGDPVGARQVLEQALAISREQPDWFTWAVLARAARDLGDRRAEDEAARNARRLAPPGARRALEATLP